MLGIPSLQGSAISSSEFALCHDTLVLKIQGNQKWEEISSATVALILLFNFIPFFFVIYGSTIPFLL